MQECNSAAVANVLHTYNTYPSILLYVAGRYFKTIFKTFIICLLEGNCITQRQTCTLKISHTKIVSSPTCPLIEDLDRMMLDGTLANKRKHASQCLI